MSRTSRPSRAAPPMTAETAEPERPKAVAKIVGPALGPSDTRPKKVCNEIYSHLIEAYVAADNGPVAKGDQAELAKLADELATLADRMSCRWRRRDDK